MEYEILDQGTDGTYVGYREGRSVKIVSIIKYPSQRAEFDKRNLAERMPYKEGKALYCTYREPYQGEVMIYQDSLLKAIEEAKEEAIHEADYPVLIILDKHLRTLECINTFQTVRTI